MSDVSLSDEGGEGSETAGVRWKTDTKIVEIYGEYLP